MDSREARMAAARQFLGALFGHGRLKDHQIQLFMIPSHEAVADSDLDKLAEAAIAAADSSNVFVRLTPIHTIPDKGRGGAEYSSAWIGAWADLDCGTVGHTSAGYAESADELEQVLADFGHRPTVLVASGGGIHAYWLLDEPMLLESEEQRDSAADLNRRFESALRQVTTAHNIKLDSTADLARVLRVPGTFNHKQKDNLRPVQLLRVDGPRYSLETIAEIAKKAPARAAPLKAVEETSWEPAPDGIASVLTWSREDLERLAARGAAASWKLQRTLAFDRPDLMEQSLSAYDMSAAVLGLLIGFSDAEAAGLVREIRLRGQAKTKHPERANDAAYLARRVLQARRYVSGLGAGNPADTPAEAVAMAYPMIDLAAGVIGYVIGARRTKTKHVAILRMMIDGCDSGRDVEVTTTEHGRERAAGSIVDIVLEARNGSLDLDVQQLERTLSREMSQEKLSQLARRLEQRKKAIDEFLAVPVAPSIMELARAWTAEELRPAFTAKDDDQVTRVWMEGRSKLFTAHEFSNLRDPGLLDAIKPARDYPASTYQDPSKASHHLRYITAAVWGALIKELPQEDGDTGLDDRSKAAGMMFRRLRNAIDHPNTVVNKQNFAKTSLRAAIEERLLAGDVPAKWSQVGEGSGLYVQFERAGERGVIRLGVRAELLTARMGKRLLFDSPDQRSLATLLKRYGLATHEDVTQPVRVDKSALKRICILTPEATYRLLDLEIATDQAGA